MSNLSLFTLHSFGSEHSLVNACIALFRNEINIVQYENMLFYIYYILTISYPIKGGVLLCGERKLARCVEHICEVLNQTKLLTRAERENPVAALLTRGCKESQFYLTSSYTLFIVL